MAEEENKAEAAPEAPSGGGGGGGKLPVILSVVNLLVGFGIIGLLVTQHNKESGQPRVEDIQEETAETKEGEEEKKKKELEKSLHDFGKMVTLEQFTVNLSMTGSVSPKFARVNISLRVPSADTEAEIVQKMPQVRNTIIDLFNSKRPNDLSSPDSRNYLKDEIQNAINSFLVSGKVRGVYFTNFALSS